MLGRDEEEVPPAVSRKREADDIDDDDDEDEPDFGGGIGDMMEEIVPVQYDTAPQQPTARVLPLPPAPQRGCQYRSCPHCGARHIVGQMLCLSCGAAIIKVSSQKQRKKIKTARWFAAEAA